MLFWIFYREKFFFYSKKGSEGSGRGTWVGFGRVLGSGVGGEAIGGGGWGVSSDLKRGDGSFSGFGVQFMLGKWLLGVF